MKMRAHRRALANRPRRRPRFLWARLVHADGTSGPWLMVGRAATKMRDLQPLTD
jgi:hypothetical protein